MMGTMFGKVFRIWAKRCWVEKSEISSFSSFNSIWKYFHFQSKFQTTTPWNLHINMFKENLWIEISSIFTQGKQKKKRVLKYQKLSKHIPQLISAALRCEPFSEKTLKKSTCAVMIRIIITQGNQIFLYSWISVSGTPDKWNFY